MSFQRGDAIVCLVYRNLRRVAPLHFFRPPYSRNVSIFAAAFKWLDMG